MNAEISLFVICVEAIIYLLLYNLHDCTFKFVQVTTLVKTLSKLTRQIQEQFSGLFFLFALNSRN